MADFKAYHTVEDTDDPEYINRNAPFKSEKKGWLGSGYYLWEEYIENAHYWGEKHYVDRGKKYAICSLNVNCDDETYLDLAGNTEHLQILRVLRDRLDKKLKGKVPKVNTLIEFARRTGEFPYQLIRLKDVNSKGDDLMLLKKNMGKGMFLDLRPKFVLFFFDKSKITLSNIKLEYPVEYNEDWVT